MFYRINMKKTVMILTAVMLGSFAIAVMLGIQNIGSSHFGDSLSGIVDTERAFDLDNVSEICIKAVSSEISFIPAEGKQIIAHLYGKDSLGAEAYLVADKKDNRVTIGVEHKRRLLFTAYPHSRLDIYLPANYCEALDLETKSGDVKIGEQNLKSLSFISASGDLQAGTLNSDTVFKTKSGDVEIKQFSGKLDFESSSGNLDICCTAITDDVFASSIAGEIRIKLPADTEFCIESETINGKLDSVFPITVNKSGKGYLEGRVGGGGYGIKVKTTSGSVFLLR